MNKFSYLQQYNLYFNKKIYFIVLYLYYFILLYLYYYYMTNILYVTKSIIKSFFNISECQK